MLDEFKEYLHKPITNEETDQHLLKSANAIKKAARICAEITMRDWMIYLSDVQDVSEYWFRFTVRAVSGYDYAEEMDCPVVSASLFKLSSLGGDYAYNTSALTKVLKSYRYYTDSVKLSSYGDSATMKINLFYVCRPPLVRLNYQYDATTKRYTLISTSPASLDSSDDLEYAFANSSAF